jgi:hypothetical protein
LSAKVEKNAAVQRQNQIGDRELQFYANSVVFHVLLRDWHLSRHQRRPLAAQTVPRTQHGRKCPPLAAEQQRQIWRGDMQLN